MDIPQPLHDTLRKRAEQSGTSIRGLIVRAVEQAYGHRKKGDCLTGPPVTRPGKLGPHFPEDENPHDLVFP